MKLKIPGKAFLKSEFRISVKSRPKCFSLNFEFHRRDPIVRYFQYTNSIFSFNAPVCDISFAHTNSAFFGAIDEVGTILIFSLDQKKDQKSIHVSYI